MNLPRLLRSRRAIRTTAYSVDQAAEGIFAMKHAKELDLLPVLWFVAKAHMAALKSRHRLRTHSISPRQVASL